MGGDPVRTTANPNHWAFWSWVHPKDWCDESSVLLVFCQQFCTAPVWYIFCVADAIGLWFTLVLCMRLREQKLELGRTPKLVSKDARARKFWSTAALAVRLATLRHAPYVKSNFHDKRFALEGWNTWKTSWELVAMSRAQRKSNASKIDFDIHSTLLRATGSVTVLLVSVQIAYVYHAGYTIGWLQLGFSQELNMCACSLVGVLVARIYYDLFVCWLCDPGFSDDRAPAESPSLVSFGGVQEAIAPKLFCAPPDAEELEHGLGFFQQGKRWCGKCNAVKPDRCHHCRVCRRCVLKMDHHCPVVGNCVGLRNHRNFCFLLTGIFIGCCIASLVLSFQAFDAVMAIFGVSWMHWVRRLHVLSAWWVSFVAQATVGPFLFYHLRLILVDETTLEWTARTRGRKDAKRNNAVECRPTPSQDCAMENFSKACCEPPWFARTFMNRMFKCVLSPRKRRRAGRSA